MILGHGMHAVRLPVLRNPLAHTVQLLCPICALNVLGGHNVHVVAATLLSVKVMYVPEGHPMHALAPEAT